MKLLNNFAVSKQGEADQRGPTVVLLLQSAGGTPHEWLLTREKAVALIADVMVAIEPGEDAPDAGRVRV